MTTFEQDGYLADDDGGFKEQLHVNHADYISICMKINMCAQNLQTNLKANKESLPEVIASVLFVRITSTYQAAILLSYKGLHWQMDMLIRCMLDYAYRLEAIAKKPLFAKELFGEGTSLKLKKCNKFLIYFQNRKNENIKSNNDIKKDEEMIKLLQDEIARIMEELPKDKNGKPIKKVIKTEYCAKIAEMESDYHTLYSDKCDAVHASIYAIEDALIPDENNNEIIDGISNLPDFDEIGQNYYILAKILASSVKAVCKVLGYGVSENIEKWITELDEIARRNITNTSDAN